VKDLHIYFLLAGQSPHVALYIRGAKGSPSLCRLFKYPNLETSPVASKSFSQTDKVEMIWNKRGTGCLIMTSTDVDSSGVSYYGKQALHFLATSGDSYSVPLSKFDLIKISEKSLITTFFSH
jgi:translation initiation factor 2A